MLVGCETQRRAPARADASCGLTAGFGVVTLGIGNGCLAFAEQWIPSGLAALFVSTSPFWLVGVEALAPRGERLHCPPCGECWWARPASRSWWRR